MDQFSELIDAIGNVKDKLSDNEYLQLMDACKKAYGLDGKVVLYDDLTLVSDIINAEFLREKIRDAKSKESITLLTL